MKLDLVQILNRVHHSDCVAFMKTLPDNCIDSIVTDPPYELGFMSKSWDNTGIANSVEMRAECLRILKTGGHLLSFSGTRTYHRMACAIEDAGFEVRDMIEWVYGSGFPKSLNIGKAVDKLQGNEREQLGDMKPAGFKTAASGYKDNKAWSGKVTKGNSEWEGWGTALKPAHEPICMARKPLSESTVAENCLKWGTGGINIDESRVGTTDKLQVLHGSFTFSGGLGADTKGKKIEFVDSGFGRFPANLIHDNSEEVRECFPETGVSRGGKTGGGVGFGKANQITSKEDPGFGDSGNASRFFKSIIYQAKASKSERNKGCEELETKDAGASMNSRCATCGKQKLDHETSRCKCEVHIPAEMKSREGVKNNHPTVKPIALMEYLIKMVTREGGIVFDPFTGSGTTLVAAKKNGYQYLGTEMTEEYIPIIEARLNATEFTPKEEEIIDKGRFG